MPAGFLAQIAAASGEPWRFHLVSRTVGAVEGHLVETQIETEGDRSITRRCSGNVCVGIYSNGARSAAFSYNGTPIPQTVPLDPISLALRTIASYEFVSDSFRATGGRTIDAGTRTDEGQVLRALEVGAPGLEPLDALIDPATNLLRAIARADGTVLARFADERKVGTLVLPYRIERPGSAAESFEERTIDPAPLRPPVGPQISFSAGETTVALSAGPAIPRFACRVQGVAATCLLDTGAAGMAMTLDLADRLHKAPIGQISIEGLGRVLTGVVRAESLDVAEMHVGSALYAIIPDAGPVKADVVIGADVIGRCIVRLDLAHRSVAFRPLGTPLRGETIPLAFDEFTPLVAMDLGTLPAILAIDTGDEASIDLPMEIYKQHPTLFTPKERRAVVGVGGRGTQSIGTIDNVRFGVFTLNNVPIGATDVDHPLKPRIGASFLNRFKVELDYTNARMSLERVS